MPTPTLNLSSPYEKIFSTSPNYSKLKSFCCLCYPWLRPYTTTKLEPRSKPCVFLGYSLTQSAYYCLDPSTSKIYVSRHVKFVESVFPFSHLSTLSSCPQSDSIATEIPPPLQIPTLSLVPPLNWTSAMDAQQQSPREASPPLALPTTSVPPPSCAPSNTNNSQQPSPQINPPEPQPQPTHTMTIRAKNNIRKPLTKMILHTHLAKCDDHEPTTLT